MSIMLSGIPEYLNRAGARQLGGRADEGLLREAKVILVGVHLEDGLALLDACGDADGLAERVAHPRGEAVSARSLRQGILAQDVERIRLEIELVECQPHPGLEEPVGHLACALKGIV